MIGDVGGSLSVNRFQCPVADHYILHEQIGKGGYATVWRGECRKSGEEVALKRFKRKGKSLGFVGAKERGNECNIAAEVAALARSDHPHCLSLHALYEDAEEVVVVMELCRGGDLFDQVAGASRSEEDARAIFSNIVAAVQHLHSRGVIHRDIKPENVFLSPQKGSPQGAKMHSDEVRLGDFNLSKILSEEETKRCSEAEGLVGTASNEEVGTLGYCAPENLDQRWQGCDARAQDCWSLGVMLYILIAGYPPFPLNKPAEARWKTLQGKYVFHEKKWKGVSEKAKGLVRGLLVVDPSKRLKLDEVVQHEWMQGDGNSCVGKVFEQHNATSMSSPVCVTQLLSELTIQNAIVDIGQKNSSSQLAKDLELAAEVGAEVQDPIQDPIQRQTTSECQLTSDCQDSDTSVVATTVGMVDTTMVIEDATVLTDCGQDEGDLYDCAQGQQDDSTSIDNVSCDNATQWVEIQAKDVPSQQAMPHGTYESKWSAAVRQCVTAFSTQKQNRRARPRWVRFKFQS